MIGLLVLLRPYGKYTDVASTVVKRLLRKKKGTRKNSDTGNRTPGYRVRGDNVSHYTISDYNVFHFPIQMFDFAISRPSWRQRYGKSLLLVHMYSCHFISHPALRPA